MSFSNRDPKGYYKTLGVPPDADASTIKSAFRSRAKDVHPDANDAPDAAAKFHALQEAYEVLSDTIRRKGYDAKATYKPKADPKPSPSQKQQKAKPHAGRQEKPKAQRQSKAEPPPRSKPQSQSKPKAEPRADPKPKSKTATGIKPKACACGKVSAQPRYVEFDMVRGLGRRVQKRTQGEIYCRGCADRAGLKASLISWLAGWWAWPMGPKETWRTIWSNMRGGRMPQAQNADLLLHQAKAFRDRGDDVIAKAIAKQGLIFASTGPTRAALDSVLASLGDVADKPLKNPWRQPGWMPMVHLAPAALIVVALSMSVSISTPAPLSRAVDTVRDLFQGPGAGAGPAILLDTRYTTARRTVLRTGPGDAYAPQVMLTAGVTVTPKELSQDGSWARIETAAGEVGFLNTSDLRSATVP